MAEPVVVVSIVFACLVVTAFVSYRRGMKIDRYERIIAERNNSEITKAVNRADQARKDKETITALQTHLQSECHAVSTYREKLESESYIKAALYKQIETLKEQIAILNNVRPPITPGVKK